MSKTNYVEEITEADVILEEEASQAAKITKKDVAVAAGIGLGSIVLFEGGKKLVKWIGGKLKGSKAEAKAIEAVNAVKEKLPKKKVAEVAEATQEVIETK